MLKHIIAIIALSALVILTMAHAQTILMGLLSAHDWLSDRLKDVFAGGVQGDVTRQLIALLCIPLLVGLVPAGIYWLAKRHWLPCFMECVWVTWLIETTALIILYKPLVA